MWNTATTPNGALGSKLMWKDFDWLRSSLGQSAGGGCGPGVHADDIPEPAIHLAAACGQSAARHIVVGIRPDRDRVWVLLPPGPGMRDRAASLFVTTG
jgi:hypothetical protein